jgi:hypothetical protein
LSICWIVFAVDARRDVRGHPVGQPARALLCLIPVQDVGEVERLVLVSCADRKLLAPERVDVRGVGRVEDVPRLHLDLELPGPDVLVDEGGHLRRDELRADGALEVDVLDERDRGVRLAEDQAILRDSLEVVRDECRLRERGRAR